ncbi:MAG: L-lysine 6-transaminase [Candidatus Neomarinimicrobiota bacterium]|nr:MAG: L-lysine 6-transaminase [Candidatus Neomarinimicrobiota bacterium]
MINISAAKVHETLGKHMLADGLPPVIDLEKSHGSWLVDAATGREYLDLFSMFASLSIGYNHPRMVEQKERLTRAAINKPTNSDIYSVPMAEFVETLATVAQPDYLPYTFFVEGGALAVENALKAAFDWKVRKNLQQGKPAKGSKVIHFRECFHGRTGYTLSLTDSPDPRKTLYFPKFDWPRITNPKLTFPLTESNLAEVQRLEEQALAEIRQVLEADRDEIAALIIEPIQGEGGDNHFRPEFFRALRSLADEYEFLLIYDEVQSGVGLTGKMWAHEHFGPDARPDIISFGKKTQVCGIFASRRLDEVKGHVFQESSRINSTWGGNLTDMVRFTMYLEIIRDENLVQAAEQQGAYLLRQLEELQSAYPKLISNVRGKGLMCAFDLPSGEQRDQAVEKILEAGAIILGCGRQSIRFRPHLNITRDEIDQAMNLFRKVFQTL